MLPLEPSLLRLRERSWFFVILVFSRLLFGVVSVEEVLLDLDG